jgi:hypothetical protein
MTSSCAIHQPNLFPRLSTLAKLYAADVWVVLDSVQYNHQDYQHRARLARVDDPDDQQWLSLPVHRPRGQLSRLDEIQLADPAASQRRMARLLQQYYGRSRYWPDLLEQLHPLLALMGQTSQLADITETSTRILLRLSGWQGTVAHSSDLLARTGRSARLADLTRSVGARTYLCGTGGWRYLNQQLFADSGITVHRFTPPASSGQDNLGPWTAAQKVSALRALMRIGPAALESELQRVRHAVLADSDIDAIPPLRRPSA